MNSPSLFCFKEYIPIANGAVLLKNYVGEDGVNLLIAVNEILAVSPPVKMLTPYGYTMSVAMTNAGQVGWVADRKGYRYSPVHPATGAFWPEIPSIMLQLATSAAAQAGYPDFLPDACLINVYEPGAKMALHQDRDERDFTQPIVSVSLGLTATFMFGGKLRTDKPSRMQLDHGDVVVWGGASRLNFHGVAPLKAGEHPILGQKRLNLTFRKAL